MVSSTSFKSTSGGQYTAALDVLRDVDADNYETQGRFTVCVERFKTSTSTVHNLDRAASGPINLLVPPLSGVKRCGRTAAGHGD